MNFSTRDEIGELSGAINKMAGELESEIAERKHAEAEVKTNLE